MPEHEETSSPYPIRIADEFIDDLARIWSHRVVEQIQDLLRLLPTTPELGSTRVRRSLKQRYGDNLRMLTVSTFIIIYRFDGITVDVLALVYGPSVM